MGRVYKALMRAERWKEQAPPIDNPASNTADPGRRPEPKKASAPEPLLPAIENADLDGFISPSFSQPFTEAPAGRQNDSVVQVNFQAEPAVAAPIVQAPRLRVATVPPPAPAFVEPKMAVSVFNLSVHSSHAGILGNDALAGERYRTLAVRLLNMSARRKLKTLLITSAHEGEGKSTVAANLAWVMAKKGERRVLLIDADLRCPAIDRRLGLKPAGGWLDLAEGRSSFEDIAVRIDPNGLYVLAANPAGGPGGRPSDEADHAALSDALTSSRVEKLLTELEQHFDFILIDAPPILEFADAQRLASMADGTVAVVRAGRTHHAAVTDALKLVPKERRVGVVLNEAQVEEEITYHGRKKSSGLWSAFKSGGNRETGK